MMLLILLLAAIVIATIATVVDLRNDGYRRIPDRRFGPAGTQDADAYGRSRFAGMR